jgi:hypothetical protein
VGAAEFNLTGMGIYGGGGDVEKHIGEGLLKREETRRAAIRGSAGAAAAGAAGVDGGVDGDGGAPEGVSDERRRRRHRRALLRGRESASPSDHQVAVEESRFALLP